MPDFPRMCIPVTTPPWSRVRHWSAPQQREIQEKPEKEQIKKHISDWDLCQRPLDEALLENSFMCEARANKLNTKEPCMKDYLGCQNSLLDFLAPTTTTQPILSETSLQNDRLTDGGSFENQSSSIDMSLCQSFDDLNDASAANEVSIIERPSKSDYRPGSINPSQNISDIKTMWLSIFSTNTHTLRDKKGEECKDISEATEPLPKFENACKSGDLSLTAEELNPTPSHVSHTRCSTTQSSPPVQQQQQPSSASLRCHQYQLTTPSSSRKSTLNTFNTTNYLKSYHHTQDGSPCDSHQQPTCPNCQQNCHSQRTDLTRQALHLSESQLVSQVSLGALLQTEVNRVEEDTGTCQPEEDSGACQLWEDPPAHHIPDITVIRTLPEPPICYPRSETHFLNFFRSVFFELFSSRPVISKRSSRRKGSIWLSVWVYICSALLVVSPVSCKVCSTIYVNHMSQMSQLRGCTVIEGSLSISTMFVSFFGNATEPTDEEMSFPELREITDYLLLCQVEYKIKSLAKVFPNLTVIRGNRLVQDYALLIREMKGMQDIGLISLTHIMRGGVYLNRNTDLCYVNNINWKAIVKEKYHHAINTDDNSIMNKYCFNKCPEGCPDQHCWNAEHCQRIKVDCPNNVRGNCYRNGTNENGQLLQCDMECLGGCSGPSPDNCFACSKARITGPNGGCRSICPAPSLLYENWRCISEKECSNMTGLYNAESIGQLKPFKAYRGKCLENCPEETKEKKTDDGKWICEACENCPLECHGTSISSIEDIQRFKGCTTIKGSLLIRISGENVVQELSLHLNRVKIITGSLKISRSFPIVSLDFFANLEEIQGIQVQGTIEHKTHYSLTIIENENLQKLFPALPNGKQLKIMSRNGEKGPIMPGKASIFYNPKLCVKEIRKLLNTSGLEQPSENSTGIYFATNGDKAVCSENKLQLTYDFPNDNNTFGKPSQRQVIVTFTNYQSELFKSRIYSSRSLLNYEIHYREIDEVTYLHKNLTKYGDRDACGFDDWEIIDHPPSDPTLDNTTGLYHWPFEATIITIRPYTYYAFYVTTVIVKDVAVVSDIDGAQSDIVYLLTPEDYPSSPESIGWTNLNYSSVKVSWDPPASPNGIIDHYDLVLTLNEFNSTRYLDINYCDDGLKQTQLINRPLKPVPPVNTTIGECPCDCKTCGVVSNKKKGEKLDDKLDDKYAEEKIYDSIIDLFAGSLRPPSFLSLNRKKRSIDKLSIGNELVDKIEEQDYIEILDGSTPVDGHSPKSTSKRPSSRKRKSDNIYIRYSIRIPGNVRFAVIPDLLHDSTYNILLRACHKVKEKEKEHSKLCSNDRKLELKTDPKPHADDIPGSLTVHRATDSSSGGNETKSVTYISWEPPKNPNTLITRYYIRSTKVDDKNYMLDHCLTAKEFEAEGRRYMIKFTGTYNVKVQAVALNGQTGAWTEEVSVSVADDNKIAFYLSIILPILLILAILLGIGVSQFIKKNKKDKLFDNIGYGDPSAYFPRGQYWIERDDVSLGQLIGGGAFGEVHEGYYNHPERGRLKVAIKMLRENADARDRKMFLEEANLMRNLHSPHIVGLVGAVPVGFPAYILLEMMHGGDLKKFLRDARPLSLNRQAVRPTPTERELLQMALEIADGMAYLSSTAQSIIHRDLAARNCLLTAENVVKVGDFGRARDIYESEYYRQTFRGMVPVRWMPPEALRDGEYKPKSDVWSYGVVLWEMATLAEEPYQGMQHEEVVRFIIENRGTPEIRAHFSETFKTLMRKCWATYPDDRPTFLDILRTLEPYANDRFKKCSFYNSPECIIPNSEEMMEEMIPLYPPEDREEGNGINNERPETDPRAQAAMDLGSTPNHHSETQDNVFFRNPSLELDLKRMWSQFNNRGTKQRRTHDSA